MSSRQPISKKLRFEIFKRDEFRCQYCGRQTPGVVLELDHIIPVAEGGTDKPSNLITSCFDCNRGKGKTKLNKSALNGNTRAEDIQELAELQEQIKEYERLVRAKQRAEKKALTQINEYWSEKADDKYSLNASGLSSLSIFLKSLTASEIMEAIDIAAARVPVNRIEDRFKYLCGICNNKIKQKSGDFSTKTYNKIKNIWLTQSRGSGYFKDWELKQICKEYPEDQIITAIEECYSQRRSSYWEAFKAILCGGDDDA